MRQNNQSVLWALIILSLSLINTGCGINHKPHFGDKTFGQTLETGSDNLPVTSPNPEAPSREETTEPATEPETNSPTDAVFGHYGFNGYFNLDSVHRILRGEDERNGEISQGGSLDSLLAGFLKLMIGKNSRETLSMLVKQNGQQRNTVTQDAETEGGDSIANLKGSESQSGTQILDWALTRPAQNIVCPNAFICIERMVWVPKSGQTMTYCFHDQDTRTPIVIPYSPNSQFGSDAFSLVVGGGLTSKPFLVTTHPGNVLCNDPNVETRDVELVTYKISMGDLRDRNRQDFLQRAIHQKLIADTEIAIEFSLFDPVSRQNYLPKSGPFIDQRVRLSSKTRFFLNTSEQLVVKIERTVQSPLKIEGSQIADTIRSTYGRWAAYLIEKIFPKDNDTEGVQMTYSFEFCTHLGIVQNPFNHCTGQ